MAHRAWLNLVDTQPGAPGLRTLTVSDEEWREVAQELAAAGGRLVALWASEDSRSLPIVRAVFLAEKSGLVLNLSVSDPQAPYPGLEDIFPAAARMQRALADLSGLRSTDSDTRPWLRHAAWPQSYRPLIDPKPQLPVDDPALDAYEFVRVEGEGVHEIAVGPVHAGIIEPGHFRFSVVGEKVLRLEERLAYVHKGIERRFTELPILEGHRLAARVSGDSAVAFSWAYCQALEGVAGTQIPARAAWLRALCLELERVANHLGDLGALGNDAGFAFGLAQFSRLKEDVLRLNAEAFGHRLLMDLVVPGGIARDLEPVTGEAMQAQCARLARELRVLRDIYDEHAGLQDRFRNCGQVTPELAAQLGLTGFAARASGRAEDLRCDFPTPPYDTLAVRRVTRTSGDVAA